MALLAFDPCSVFGGAAGRASSRHHEDRRRAPNPQSVKVLYFSPIDLGTEDNGGALVCREHVQRLAAAPESIDLTVAALGQPISVSDAWRRANEFVTSLGARYHHLAMWPTIKLRPDPLSWCPRTRWPFALELSAIHRPYIDAEFAGLVRDLRPDIVVIDYVPGAVWIPSVFRLPVKRVTITLNREAEFHRSARVQGTLNQDVSASPKVDRRVERFERWVYNNSHAVVALSPDDVPRHLNRAVRTAVIEPVLRESQARWQFRGSQQIFFVGNIRHYPNREAIEWLATRFAPLLKRTAPGAMIKIIGAQRDQVPSEWQAKNVEYLGTGEKQDVQHCFTTSDLFIAPIANNFGSKMKVLECIAHGTPAIATREALTGIPFAGRVPQFRLDEPDQAVDLSRTLMADGERLNRLSAELTAQLRQMSHSTQDSWKALIDAVGRQPLAFRRPHFGRFLASDAILCGAVPAPRLLRQGLEICLAHPRGVSDSGFYDVIPRGFRWTSDRAEISIPLHRFSWPRRLIVEIAPPSPPEGTAYRIYINEREVFQGLICGVPASHRFKLRSLFGASRLTVRFESSLFKPGPKSQMVGLAIKSVALKGGVVWL